MDITNATTDQCSASELGYCDIHDAEWPLAEDHCDAWEAPALDDLTAAIRFTSRLVGAAADPRNRVEEGI